MATVIIIMATAMIIIIRPITTRLITDSLMVVMATAHMAIADMGITPLSVWVTIPTTGMANIITKKEKAPRGAFFIF